MNPVTTTGSVFDVDKNLTAIENQWPALLALCADETTFSANAPKVSGWSVGKQVHHVCAEMALIAGAIENMLAHPEQGAGLSPTHPYAMTLLEKGRMPRGSGEAPQDVRPPDTVQRAETRAMICSAGAQWEAISAKRDAIRTNRATYPHPILGPFTCAYWLRFIPLHTAHHLKIIRDILVANALPVPFEPGVDNVN